MKRILVANWKMNPASPKDAERLFLSVVKTKLLKKLLKDVEIIICPPFIYLENLINLKPKTYHLKPGLGAQDVFWENPIPGGAFTGEISISMLKKIGVSYVIVGHSERRKHLNETDGMINKKVLAALKAGLKVILCVGEPLAVRKKGLSAAKAFVKGQLLKDLKGIYNPKPITQNLIIAYEPIWAIGTGKPDDPSETAQMSTFIKDFLKTKTYNLKPSVLYGGSVTSSNAGRIFEHNEIDGALVGGASLKAEEFKKIIKIAK